MKKKIIDEFANEFKLIIESSSYDTDKKHTN